MSIFSSISSMFSPASAGFDSGSGDASYTQSPLLGVYKQLSYKDCSHIYKYWPLGKRVATALPNFASTSPSELECKGAPIEVKERLESVAKQLGIEAAVIKLSVYVRIFGMSSLYIASKELKPDEALTYDNAQKANFSLNVLDPLAAGANFLIDNDPLSPTFSKVISSEIRGCKIHTGRLLALSNEYPLYYEWNNSNWSFGGPSIYTNMTLLIRTWNLAMVSLQRLATKSSAMYVNLKDSPNTTGVTLLSNQRNLEMIRSLENDGIVGLKNGETPNFFPTSSIGSFINDLISVINTALMMALSDTPSGILLDKNLSSGLADGSEDMKAILMSVERFRTNILRPAVDFCQKLLLYKAFSPRFLNELKAKYPDLYRDKTISNMLEELIAGFEWKFGELYPQTLSQMVEMSRAKIEMLNSLKNLGAATEGLEEALNSINAFNGVEFTLEEQHMDEGGDDDGDDGDSHTESGDNNSGVSDSSDAVGNIPNTPKG